MSTINDTDKFLVNRSSSSYSVDASDLMSTIQDDDLMLIQRNGASYKVTCQDVKEQLGKGDKPVLEAPSVVTPPNGAGLAPGAPYYPQSSDITSAASDVIDGAWKYGSASAGYFGVYGGGRYWLVSGNGSDSKSFQYQYSDDGISWTQKSASSTNGRAQGIAYGNGKLVITASSAVSGSSSVVCSTNADPTDGFFTKSNPENRGDYGKVAFGNGRLWQLVLIAETLDIATTE